MAVLDSRGKKTRERRRQLDRALQVLMLGIAWMVLALTGCGGDPLATDSGGSADTGGSPAAKPETGGGFDSPEAVFEAEKQAQIDGDWGAHFDVYTPESQDQLVGTLAYTSGLFGGITGKDAEVKAILKKHGIDESMMPEKPSITSMADMDAMMKKMEEAQEKLTAAIKDKRAFYIEMAALMNGTQSGNAADPQAQAFLEKARKAQETAKLVDVSTLGDRGQGKRVIMNNGTPMEVPVYFKKIDGSWHMRQPTMEESRKIGEQIGRATAEKMRKDAAQKSDAEKQ